MAGRFPKGILQLPIGKSAWPRPLALFQAHAFLLHFHFRGFAR